MTTKEIKKTARIAGLLYLVMAPFAVFGVMYVPSITVVPGDAAATASSIMANETLFRGGIVSALFVQIGHLFLALVLYKLLKQVNKDHAVLMVIFMLVGIPITMINELNQFAALLLSSGAEHLTAFTADQMQALVPRLLDLHQYGIAIAWIFWGLWLLPMGYLVFKSGYIPKILGVLLVIAGFSYLIDFVTFSLFPNVDVLIAGIASYGEFPLFPLWLLIKGVNVEEWEKRARESA